MSVDLISHFTPQKIFNKSKRRKRKKKKKRTELLSQVSEMESPTGNWSQSFGGSLKKHRSAFPHSLSVGRRRAGPCCLQLISQLRCSPRGNSLARSVKPGEGSHFWKDPLSPAACRKRRARRLQHLPAPRQPQTQSHCSSSDTSQLLEETNPR